ncbi:hypothetical protein K402DRAFT_252901 [Aulographum hederae CBS 113979]|uniref:Uncharacterized protein n=1 Tax=Aulographum hederae CBS 113979 TaxID=1176131 RepID=A0A6G1GJ75_9PEZI|nr:hypothetical protein K402DRAFT_252901 [Aulographum hederae CBS 113979]
MKQIPPYLDPPGTDRCAMHKWLPELRKHMRNIELTIQVVPEVAASIWLSPLFTLEASGFCKLVTVNVCFVAAREWTQWNQDGRHDAEFPDWFLVDDHTSNRLRILWDDRNTIIRYWRRRPLFAGAKSKAGRQQLLMSRHRFLDDVRRTLKDRPIYANRIVFMNCDEDAEKRLSDAAVLSKK